MCIQRQCIIIGGGGRGCYYSEVSQAVFICPSGKVYVEGKVERWELNKVR
jgi:hypothetical protein